MSARSAFSLLVLGLIHLAFIAFFVRTESISMGVKAVTISSMVFLIVGYVYSIPKTSSDLTRSPKIEILLFPFTVAVAGVLTFYVSVDLLFGPVIASAGIGFLASYLPVISKSAFFKSLPAPIYCGTFVGMCSNFLTGNYFFVAYAGLVAGLIYIITRSAMNGIGGKLGTIAFGGVIVVSFIYSLL